ncbi:MAG: alpha-1,2-fucosyltransferase [Candidatus Binatia bacterium]
MVEVFYDGNLGNHLFQYCFGRLLAEALQYRLVAPPIDGFPGTYETVDGHSFESNNVVVLRGQKPDLSFMQQSDGKYHVIVSGYFQRTEYYAPRAAAVRRWLAVHDRHDYGISENDVVVGIRRGRDYIPQHGLPLSYYDNALALLEHDRVFVCTNDPDDGFVRYFSTRHKAIVRPPSALDNFAFIRQFRKIVISNSTFLWWAAYLSEAGEIVFPRPANGLWSANDPISKNISLEVDEPRYRYLACEKYKSEFAAEILLNWRDAILSRGKTTIRKCLPFARRRTHPGTATMVFHE